MSVRRLPLKAGIPGLNLDNFYTSGLPEVDVSRAEPPETSIGYALTNNTHCNCPLTEQEQQYQLVGNLTKTNGNHTFKMGADLRYALNLRVPSDSHRAGELGFNGNYTGFLARRFNRRRRATRSWTSQPSCLVM